MNDLLSIVIPTYNRSDILCYNINYALKDIVRFNIPIYISDDSLDSKTQNAILEIKKKYPNIFYSKNIPSLGHDKNCVQSLSLPDTKYIWYLGDSMIIHKGAIEKIISIIKFENPDFICFKEENREIDYETQIFSSAKKILENLCWHLTMSGVTVYKKEILRLNNFPFIDFPNFPQLALIFLNFIDNKSKLFWLNEKLIVGNINKKSYWSKDVFSVFFDDLKTTLTYLPQKFNKSEIDKVIKDHSIKSKLFGYHSMVLMRITDVYNYQSFISYRKKLKQYTNKSIFFLIFLSIFSKNLLAFFYNIVKRKTNHTKKSK